MGKVKTVDFSETVAASDLKVSRSKVVYKQKFKPDFLRNYFVDLYQIFHKSFQVQENENLMT